MNRAHEVVLALSLLVATPAVAAVRFEATVDRDKVEVGDTLTLTVTVSVPNRDRIESLVLPEFKGLEVVSRSRSSEMSYRFDPTP